MMPTMRWCPAQALLTEAKFRPAREFRARIVSVVVHITHAAARGLKVLAAEGLVGVAAQRGSRRRQAHSKGRQGTV